MNNDSGSRKIPPPNVVFREAKITDALRVKRLAKRNGLTGEISINAWDWLWNENPAYDAKWPIGWVLENSQNQELVGYIGNVPRKYVMKGGAIRVACARAFMVDIAFRRHALKLIAAFFKQEAVDLYIFTGVNILAAPLYQLAGAKRMPQLEFNNALYWIVSAPGLIKAVLLKRGIPKFLAEMFSYPVGLSMNLLQLVTNMRPLNVRNGLSILEIQPQNIGQDFDDFWRRWYTNENEFLSADRSSALLKWQFAHAGIPAENKTIFITVWENSILMGYLVLARRDSDAFGLKRLMVRDLVVIDNRADLVHELMKATIKYAKSAKVHLLQVVGLPKSVRRGLEDMMPRYHLFDDSSFLYFSNSGVINDFLVKPENWYPSLIDGDSSL